MINPTLPLLLLLLPPWVGAQHAAKQTPETMTKMVVRLTGPQIKSGSFAALPKTIYRAGDQYARIEDPPDSRQKMEKLTIIAGPDAYSINLIEKKGTHAVEKGDSNDSGLPIILPFDQKHKLGNLDQIEFGSEYEFFKAAGVPKQAGPIINAKPTDAYTVRTPNGAATLVLRSGTETPVWLSWQTSDGSYRYEYITYEDVPFQADLFKKPAGIEFKEMPSDPNASNGDR